MSNPATKSTAEVSREIAADHNKPPSIINLLDEELAITKEKLDPLVTALEERTAKVTKIENEEQAQAATDLVSDLQKLSKQIDDKKTIIKRPWLDGCSKIEDLFKTKKSAVDLCKGKIQNLQKAYIKKKDEDAREAARIEAAKKAEESNKLIENAAILEGGGMAREAQQTLQKAVVLDNQANRINHAVEHGNFGSVRSESGAVTSQRKEWKAEVADLATLDLNKLKHLFKPEDIQTALNKYMKANLLEQNGTKFFPQTSELAGAKFFEDITIVNRSA